MAKTYTLYSLLTVIVLSLTAAHALADNVAIYETQTITTVAPVSPTANYAEPMPFDAANHTMAVMPQTNSVSPNTVSTSDQLQPMHEGNITYITGGIGDEERNELDAAKKDYNLHLTNADKTGAFTGDTRVAILDHQGNQVLNVPTGPIFLATLAPGKYTIEATAGAQVKKQTVIIGRGKAASLHMSW